MGMKRMKKKLNDIMKEYMRWNTAVMEAETMEVGNMVEAVAEAAVNMVVEDTVVVVGMEENTEANTEDTVDTEAAVDTMVEAKGIMVAIQVEENMEEAKAATCMEEKAGARRRHGSDRVKFQAAKHTAAVGAVGIGPD